jgi:hypothetical protein
MWKKYGTARQVTHENIIRHVRIVGWITKATDTHSENVIFTVFPLQQLLHERAPVLCYAHTEPLIRFTQKREVSDRLGHEAATLGV